MPDWSAAQAHLAAHAPGFAALIEKVGPCTLAPRGDPFTSLARAIFTQQISTAVATVLFKRFRALFPRGRPTPALTLELTETQLRSAGLSRQKIAYLRDLAEHFVEGKLSFRQLHKRSDDEVIEMLTQVHGIGKWTGQMFLIFNLNRPDVLPTGDLGLLKAAQRVSGLEGLPTERQVTKLAEAWRPWRTVATWYLWRGG